MVLSSVLLAVVVLAGLLALGRSAIDVAMPEIICSLHVPRAVSYGKMNGMKYHQCDLNCLPARFGLDFATAAATAPTATTFRSGRIAAYRRWCTHSTTFRRKSIVSLRIRHSHDLSSILF